MGGGDFDGEGFTAKELGTIGVGDAGFGGNLVEGGGGSLLSGFDGCWGDDFAPGHQCHAFTSECFDDDYPEPREGDDDDEQDGEGRQDSDFFPHEGANNLGKRLATMSHASGEDEEVLDGTGEANADNEPYKAGHITELDGENWPDQGAGPGDGGEMMAEEDPTIGRMVILSVIKLVSWGGSCRIDHCHAGGEEGTVESIGHRHSGENPEENGHRMHKSQ